MCNLVFTLSLHSFGLWLISIHGIGCDNGGIELQEASVQVLLQSALQNLKAMGSISLLSSKAYNRLQSLFDLVQEMGRQQPFAVLVQHVARDLWLLANDISLSQWR